MKKIFGNTTCAIDDGNGIWFILRKHPILGFYSYEEKAVIETHQLPADNAEGEYQYIHMKKIGQYIYIIPRRARYIIAYNTNNRKVEILYENKSSSGYFKLLEYQSLLYAIPCSKACVLQIDPRDNSIIELKKIPFLENGLEINGCCTNGENAYCVVWKKETIYRYSMKADEWRVFYKGNKGDSFTQICSDKHDIFAYEETGRKLYKINIEEETAEKIIVVDKEKDIKLHGDEDEYLIIDEINSENMYVFSKELKEIRHVTIDRDDSIPDNSFMYSFNFGICLEGANYSELIMPDGWIYRMKDSNIIKSEQVYIDKNNSIDLNSAYQSISNAILYENEIANLGGFISMLG